MVNDNGDNSDDEWPWFHWYRDNDANECNSDNDDNLLRSLKGNTKKIVAYTLRSLLAWLINNQLYLNCIAILHTHPIMIQNRKLTSGKPIYRYIDKSIYPTKKVIT